MDDITGDGFEVFNRTVDKLVEDAKRLGFSCLISYKDKNGQVFSSDYISEKGQGPVCHRFNEIARCRTTVIDIALLMRDAFTEAATAYQDRAMMKPIEIREYQEDPLH